MTNIETKELETLQVRREGSLAWVGILFLEFIISLAAIHMINLISECAGLWHFKADLEYELWTFGSRLSYADRMAKWFGFRKACQNLALTVVFEALAFCIFSKCLRIERATYDTEGSAGKFFLMVGVAIRLIAYAAALFFGRGSSLWYRVDTWGFEEKYYRIAAHDRAWVLFWALVCIVLALAMFAFSSGRDNLVIIACLLSIVMLIAVGTYFNEGNKTLADAKRDTTGFVNAVGETIFRH